MHYYPEDQSNENLKKIRQNNVCAECGRQLSLYLDTFDGRTYVACSGQVHKGIAREYKPPREDYESKIRREMELEKKTGQGASTALATIPRQGQLTQPQAMHILKLVYPDVPDNEIIRTAIFCRDFGLHPLAKEVYLIPFKGKHVMVVGIPASRKMAHNLKGEFSFLEDTPRAATEKEIERQFGKDSDEAKANVISVTKLQGEGGNLAIGFGLYSKDENPYGMDKGNTKRNMANIRSERQAMDRLPGKPIPQVEVIDAAYAEVPNVDQITGEIIEGEGTVIEEEKPKPKSKGKKQAELEPETEPEPEPTPPAEKDETVIEAEQLKYIYEQMAIKGWGLPEMSQYCLKEKGWNIRKLSELHQWQFDELKDYFEKEQ